MSEHVPLLFNYWTNKTKLNRFVQQKEDFVVIHFIYIPDCCNIWMAYYSTFLLHVPKCNLLLPGGKLDFRVCLTALWSQDTRPL